jgi:23S rRNA (uracil1939-C5)-methyltransferase
MKKNEIITLEITDVTAEGNGVGHYDNMAVFVPNLITGDVADVKIVKVLKNYCYAITDKINIYSENRIESACPVSAKCGGCTFRNMSYPAQLEMKQKIVSDAFKRIGKFDINPEKIESSEIYEGYRNKAQYPFAVIDGKIVCGFYSKRSHRVIPYTACKLQPEIFSQILEYTLELLNRRRISVYNESTNTGILRHLYIRQGFHSKEIMLCFIVRKNIKRELASVVNKISEKFPDIKSIFLNINPDRTNVIMGRENICVFGKETIKDTMCGLDFNLSPMSFYQVNTPQAENLYSIAKEYANLKPSDTLIDFYCGAGTIGLSMADKVQKLIGVEIIEDAVENARYNACINNISNAEFICQDAGKSAELLIKNNIKPDVVTLDPPRKGCDDLLIDSVVKLNPERIVMISCNPSTAARDCRKFQDMGFSLQKITPVDMFPWTGHVECVVLLSQL